MSRCVHACECRCPWRPEEGVGLLGVTHGCQLPGGDVVPNAANYESVPIIKRSEEAQGPPSQSLRF